MLTLNIQAQELQSNYDVVIVGGGQAGLCISHYKKRVLIMWFWKKNQN